MVSAANAGFARVILADGHPPQRAPSSFILLQRPPRGWILVFLIPILVSDF
jgi:hypothetical protein